MGSRTWGAGLLPPPRPSPGLGTDRCSLQRSAPSWGGNLHGRTGKEQGASSAPYWGKLQWPDLWGFGECSEEHPWQPGQSGAGDKGTFPLVQNISVFRFSGDRLGSVETFQSFCLVHDPLWQGLCKSPRRLSQEKPSPLLLPCAVFPQGMMQPRQLMWSDMGTCFSSSVPTSSMGSTGKDKGDSSWTQCLVPNTLLYRVFHGNSCSVT